MGRSAAVFLLILAGCANQLPMADLPADVRPQHAQAVTNIIGEWTASAMNGAVLAEGDQFALRITATELQVQVCNTMGGSYRLDGSRLVRVGPSYSTEMACADAVGDRDIMAAEQRIFALMSSQQLMVSTPAPGTLRLEGSAGTVDFIRPR